MAVVLVNEHIVLLGLALRVLLRRKGKGIHLGLLW